MTSREVVRAWKDEEYRLSLGEAELADLPENPAGCLELSDAELEAVVGDGIIGIGNLNIVLPDITVVVCLAFLGVLNQATQINNLVIFGGGQGNQFNGIF